MTPNLAADTWTETAAAGCAAVLLHVVESLPSFPVDDLPEDERQRVRGAAGAVVSQIGAINSLQREVRTVLAVQRSALWNAVAGTLRGLRGSAAEVREAALSLLQAQLDTLRTVASSIPRVTAQERLAALDARLHACGLRRHTTYEYVSGHCMYDSLSHDMSRVLQRNEDRVSLRRMAADSIREGRAPHQALLQLQF
jgi:hypothetical protein